MPEASAGSAPSLSRPIGTSIPAIPATSRLTTIAAAITPPSAALPYQPQTTAPMITAKAHPLASPTMVSRATTRIALVAVRSRVARARTATVRVWVPALPPIEATIGISTASAT